MGCDFIQWRIEWSIAPDTLVWGILYFATLALNLKFYSLFSSVNSVQILLLNTLVITSDPLCASSLLPLHQSVDIPIAMIFFFLLLGQLWPKSGHLHLLVRTSIWNRLPLPLHSSIHSLPLYLVLSLTFFQECKCNERSEINFVYWLAIRKSRAPADAAATWGHYTGQLN